MFGPELDVLKVADPKELKKFYDLSRINMNSSIPENDFHVHEMSPLFLNHTIETDNDWEQKVSYQLQCIKSHHFICSHCFIDYRASSWDANNLIHN